MTTPNQESLFRTKPSDGGLARYFSLCQEAAEHRRDAMMAHSPEERDLCHGRAERCLADARTLPLAGLVDAVSSPPPSCRVIETSRSFSGVYGAKAGKQ